MTGTDALGRRNRQTERGKRVIDLFAEALSEHGEITAAAQAIGISRDYGKKLFSRIRKDLGWQAI